MCSSSTRTFPAGVRTQLQTDEPRGIRREVRRKWGPERAYEIQGPVCDGRRGPNARRRMCKGRRIESSSVNRLLEHLQIQAVGVLALVQDATVKAWDGWEAAPDGSYRAGWE